MNTTIKQYINLILAILFLAIGVNTVIIPYSIVAGGVSGLSAIVEYTTPLSAATFVFIANLVLIILAFLLVSPKYALNSIIGANILFPLAIAVIPVGALSSDLLLSSLFGGAMSGIGIYFLSKSNGSTGGTAITGKIIQKHFGLSYANSVAICDSFVVLAGLFIFGIENTMYAVVFIITTSVVANFFELGAQKTTVFHIITNEEDKIKDAIINDVARGVTVINATGGYNGDKRPILVCVVKKSDVMRLKATIHEVDNNAFYYIVNASSTYGQGFTLFENSVH